jgi:hypothetical protein
MSSNTYGLNDEEYLELFRKQSQFLFRTMREMMIGAAEEKVHLDGWPHDVIWKMYESIKYDATEEARVIQKKKDPETYKEFSYETLLLPSHEEINGEIKSVSAKVDALVDYLAEVLKQPKDNLTKPVD